MRVRCSCREWVNEKEENKLKQMATPNLARFSSFRVVAYDWPLYMAAKCRYVHCSLCEAWKSPLSFHSCGQLLANRIQGIIGWPWGISVRAYLTTTKWLYPSSCTWGRRHVLAYLEASLPMLWERVLRVPAIYRPFIIRILQSFE